MTRPWIDLLAEAVAIRVAATLDPDDLYPADVLGALRKIAELGAVIALNDAVTAGADLSGLAAAYTTDGDRP